jgi:hypothetical protein
MHCRYLHFLGLQQLYLSLHGRAVLVLQDHIRGYVELLAAASDQGAQQR